MVRHSSWICLPNHAWIESRLSTSFTFCGLAYIVQLKLNLSLNCEKNENQQKDANYVKFAVRIISQHLSIVRHRMTCNILDC